LYLNGTFIKEIRFRWKIPFTL